MFLILLVLSTSSIVVVDASLQSFILGYDEHCAYTREDAIKCFAKHLDTNHDHVIDLKELEAAKQKYVGWAIKLIEWVVSWKIDTSTERIMHDCGAGTKGYFTADDFRRTAKSCMPSHEAMCMIKAVCDKVDKQEADAMEEVKDPRVKTWWSKWL